MKHKHIIKMDSMMIYDKWAIKIFEISERMLTNKIFRTNI